MRQGDSALCLARAARSRWTRRPPDELLLQAGHGRRREVEVDTLPGQSDPDLVPGNTCTKSPGWMCGRMDRVISERSISSSAPMNQTASRASSAWRRISSSSSAIEPAQLSQLSFHGHHAPDGAFPRHGILLHFPALISLTWDTTRQEFVKSHAVRARQRYIGAPILRQSPQVLGFDKLSHLRIQAWSPGTVVRKNSSVCSISSAITICHLTKSCSRADLILHPDSPRIPCFDYRSCGRSPVRLATRANMRGPISSRSWNANTKSGQPGRDSTRWEPRCRSTTQPMRCSATSSSLALTDGQSLMRRRK